MPIHLVQLTDVAVEVIYEGMITLDQFLAAFQTLLEMENIEYLIANGENMMYQASTMFDEQVLELVIKLLHRGTLKKAILWLPEDNPMRQPVEQTYREMGAFDKLMIVTDLDAVKTKILQTGHP